MQMIVTKDNLEDFYLKDPGYDPATSKYYEGIMTQGNGYMHVRGSYDEGLVAEKQDLEYDRKPANVTLEVQRFPLSKWGTFVPGVVGPHPFLMTEMINQPYFFDTVLTVDGERLEMAESRISDYERILNLSDGVLTRSFRWDCRNGAALRLTYKRFISMDRKHLALSQLMIKGLSGSARVQIDAGINAGVRTNGFDHFTSIRKNQRQTGCSLEVETNGGNKVLIVSEIEADADFSGKKDINDAIYSSGTVEINENTEFLMTRYIALCTDRDQEEDSLSFRARSVIEEARRAGAQTIYDDHKAAWEKRWSASDIRIKGDHRAQLAIRASIYHLMRAADREDPRVAIGAKGHAGEAYFGRYFWDTEINMLPFFLHTDPEAARNLLMFRYLTLDGARENAKSYGYPGARYAWESSVSGHEECACWQYADHEIHVTADIAYAMKNYISATGDEEFMENFGLEILIETSRYWVKRADKNRNGEYELLAVMGPDEYLPMTRNNYYTNRMVKFSLDLTCAELESLEEKEPLKYRVLKERLGLKDDEKKLFKEVADNMRLPKTDDGSGIVPQSDDFFDYADIDFDEVWKDRSKCFGTCISQEHNYRVKALKQADVLENMLLFGPEFTDEVKSKNYDYYEPITTHDSSLSAAVHGIIAARLGRMDEAEKFLDKVIDIDMDEAAGGAKEGIHIANCGGLWQLIVYGFAGLGPAMWNESADFKPMLPAGWEELEIPFFWKGRSLKVVISDNKAVLIER